MSVSFGVASADSHKGEDCTTAVVGSGGAPSCFGVFDGHTGKQASAICQSTVCQRLLTDSRGPPLPTSAIEDVFWAVDLEIGQRDLIDGTTATVLFVESSPPEEAETPLREASSAPLREAPESGLRCVLAWVGDSTAVALDMRAAHGVPLAATRDHNPDSAEEQARMVQEEDVGETILFIAQMPPHVCLNEIHITPTWNRSYIGASDRVIPRDE